MNPLAALGGASALFGLGMTLMGTEEATSAARSEAGVSGNIANLQMQENQVRQQAMEMAGRREQIEIARKTQMTSARALSGATEQGAQFGSGIKGGQSQIRSEGAFEQAGVSSNLSLGRTMFGLDTSIDQQKIMMAKYQSDLASAQGLMQMGGAISGAGMNFMGMFGGKSGGG